MSQERSPYSNVHRVVNRNNSLDVHELLKQELLKQTPGSDSSFNPTLTAASLGNQALVAGSPSIGFEDHELYFESPYRDQSSDYSTGEIKYSISAVNNNQELRGVIEMHIGPFIFPKIPTVATVPDFFYFRRVFMELTTAPSTQVVQGQGNIKYHFEFEVSNPNGQAILLTPVKGSFFFRRPITSMTDFQVRFTVPPTNPSIGLLKNIPLPNDTVGISMQINGGLFGYDPVRYTIAFPYTTEILGLVGTLAAPGVAVFITMPTSSSNTINDMVTSTAGVFVTNIINSNTFEIGAIDSSTLSLQYGGVMYIPKNRIAFPVRFTCVREQVTNYIGITHD